MQTRSSSGQHKPGPHECYMESLHFSCTASANKWLSETDEHFSRALTLSPAITFWWWKKNLYICIFHDENYVQHNLSPFCCCACSFIRRALCLVFHRVLLFSPLSLSLSNFFCNAARLHFTWQRNIIHNKLFFILMKSKKENRTVNLYAYKYKYSECAHTHAAFRYFLGWFIYTNIHIQYSLSGIALRNERGFFPSFVCHIQYRTAKLPLLCSVHALLLLILNTWKLVFMFHIHLLLE